MLQAITATAESVQHAHRNVNRSHDVHKMSHQPLKSLCCLCCNLQLALRVYACAGMVAWHNMQ